MSAWNSREREQRMAAMRYREERQRIALIKTVLKVTFAVVAVVVVLAANAGLLYLAVRLVRLAWGS